MKHVLLLSLAACGDSHVTMNGDAADAHTGPAVQQVDCPTEPAAVITTSDTVYAYVPQDPSIAVGDTVRFTMSPAHAVISTADDVADVPGRWDAALLVPNGMDLCFAFLEPVTYRFHCPVHGFRGRVDVR